MFENRILHVAAPKRHAFLQVRTAGRRVDRKEDPSIHGLSLGLRFSCARSVLLSSACLQRTSELRMPVLEG